MPVIQSALKMGPRALKRVEYMCGSLPRWGPGILQGLQILSPRLSFMKLETSNFLDTLCMWQYWGLTEPRALLMLGKYSTELCH